MRNIIQWAKFKGWFLFDLPYFIRENNFRKGLEIGAKGGRSMYFALAANKELHLTGIDFWRILPGGAYRDNHKNEDRCRRKLRKFGPRVQLIKGDAAVLAEQIPDEAFDFILYDIQSNGTADFHQWMISRWIPKIRKGGVLIGRDFRTYRDALYNLGFKESDFRRCKIGKRVSERLEYLRID